MGTSVKRISVILFLLIAIASASLVFAQEALANEKSLTVGEPNELSASDIVHSGTFGTCDWSIDADGLFVIAPSDGVSGVLPSNNEGRENFWPWYEF